MESTGVDRVRFSRFVPFVIRNVTMTFDPVWVSG